MCIFVVVGWSFNNDIYEQPETFGPPSEIIFRVKNRFIDQFRYIRFMGAYHELTEKKFMLY